MGAFRSTGITTLVVPNTVTAIDGYAFSYCSTLVSVSFEADSSLLTIGDAAFQGAVIRSIYIPNTVTSIADSKLVVV